MTQHPPQHPLMSPTAETLSDSARSHLVGLDSGGVDLAWGSPQCHGFQIRAKGFTSEQLNALDILLSEAHKTAETRWPK